MYIYTLYIYIERERDRSTYIMCLIVCLCKKMSSQVAGDSLDVFYPYSIIAKDTLALRLSI